ncbi:LSU ribosomal protein L9P [Thermanaeromonas toyohensis ToBE]|uniref:Large ribosomal subunit protein bL9 n=1 Tax=Thermanaeromonas toyohensis ToBE TaxID=698762 RepID=A0A1W1W3F9_9FIRM|nr:50S ribosomal protein L9 [Thermanaeromonas toyohensis]SMC00023.1 LSU ribosomal protein L9P [Thermanaeromonas toyohensis ToBE]
MKVILLEDVPKLGKRGSVVEVADGYARNYLLPRKLAVTATEERLEELHREKDREAKKKQKELEEARRLARILEGSTITVVARAGEGGKLFGSVTNKEIAQAIENTFHISIDRRKIELEEPLKLLGSYPVILRLHPEVQARITVEVVTERG